MSPHTDVVIDLNAGMPGADTRSAFEERAHILTRRGIPVIPVRPGKKAAFLNGWEERATTDPDQIANWARLYPEANTGAVAQAKIGGFLILELDSHEAAERIKRETGQDIPATLTVRSREGRGHIYFKATDRSISAGNISQGIVKHNDWSLRVDRQYVVGPDSIHEKTGQPYTILTDAPIAEVPDWLIAWCLSQKVEEKKTTAASADVTEITEGSRNSKLTSIAGTIRHAGLGQEAIEAALTIHNKKHCNPPLDAAEIRGISKSVARYEVGREFFLTIGGKPVELSGPTKAAATAPAATEFIDPETCFKSVGELPDGGIDWVIQDIMPEGLNFLGALSGHGKTFFGLSLAKALTTGKPFLGKYPVPSVTPVMYLVPESSGRAFKTRCLRLGLPDDRKLFICRTISEGPVLPLNSPEVLAMVKKLKPVVFVDTAVRFSTASDENSSREQQQLWNEMMEMRLAGARGVMALHHSPKSSQNEEMTLENVLRGSGDIGAQADAVWGIRRDNTLFDNGAGPGEIDVACVKPRDFTPPAPFRLAMSYVDSHGVVASYFDTTGDFKVVQEATQQKDLGERFVKFIKEYPQASMKEVSDELNVKVCRIRKLAKEQKYHKPKGGDWMRSAPSGFAATTTREKGGPDADLNLDAPGETK